ncbi:ATP synthase F0 subunit C [Tundrisphaera sp. TA3]|uniref:ATP synthase F0 subunit C n=1 Tax=Tundrisphaera sp. TA3 TaxID=3435775 RepID=UPI003EB98DAD
MKLVKFAALIAAVFFALDASVFAQEAAAPAATTAGTLFKLNAIGIGLVIFGAAAGIGRLTASAVEAMARQPEIAANIQTAMIISAALIEGVTFFALIVLGFIVPGS